MHFWIDKRSQQCGFGRSRVAASLAHTGTGLSYGHPPRRKPSSSSSSSSHALASVHNNRAQQQQHQQQQQQQQHHYYQQQQQQYQHHHGTGASSSSSITTTADCHSSRNHHHHQQQQQQQHPQQQQQHLQQHLPINNNDASNNTIPSANMNNNAQCGSNLTNTTNNNNLATTSSAAVLTGSGAIVPVATNTLGTARGHLHARHQQRSAITVGIGGTPITTGGTSTPGQQQQQLHYDIRNYHHPQFGNMSVRHYSTGGTAEQYRYQPQPQTQSNNLQQQMSLYLTETTQQQQLQQPSNHYQQQQQQQQLQHQSINNRQSAYYAPRRNNSSNNMRGTNISNMTTTSTYCGTTNLSSGQHYQQQQQSQPQQPQQQQAVVATTDESQFLPMHLKCGMCASLILASLFVAGAKFYFDHQGSGLEVLIFCAFSATFFLAACTVSLCRVPKGFLPGRSSSRLSELAMCEAQNAGIGRIGGPNSVAGTRGAIQHGNFAIQSTAEQQITAQATAGPPPYHIAILLPEHNRSENNKQVPVDESPPPSYDKILI